MPPDLGLTGGTACHTPLWCATPLLKNLQQPTKHALNLFTLTELEGPSSGSSISAPSSNLPVLVHDQGDSQTQFIISKQVLNFETIDELRDYRCFETPQGWILALDTASLQTFLWRPEDGKRISLPSMKKDFPKDSKCLLSDNPGASVCAVLVLDLDNPKMCVCCIGGSKWRSYTYRHSDEDGNPTYEIIGRFCGIAAVGGKFYYHLTRDQLGVIEFNPELNFSGIAVRLVRLSRATRPCATYFVESCGELFLVVVFFSDRKARSITEAAVYKMDFSRPAWCKVDSIGGDRVFLLSGAQSGVSCFGASCSASSRGLRGNCIYYVNHVASGGDYLYVIDLAKGMEAQQPYKGLPTPSRPLFWLLPTEP